jgi:hypothetical protein
VKSVKSVKLREIRGEKGFDFDPIAKYFARGIHRIGSETDIASIRTQRRWEYSYPAL